MRYSALYNKCVFYFSVSNFRTKNAPKRRCRWESIAQTERLWQKERASKALPAELLVYIYTNTYICSAYGIPRHYRNLGYTYTRGRDSPYTSVQRVYIYIYSTHESQVRFNPTRPASGIPLPLCVFTVYTICKSWCCFNPTRIMYIYMFRARDAPTENVYIQYSSKPV